MEKHLNHFLINLWKTQSSQQRFPVVGKVLPGSKNKIIAIEKDDYLVKSSYDGSIGWISKIQVSHIITK